MATSRNDLPLLMGDGRPFIRAALSSRFIGAAAMTLGALSLYTGRKAEGSAQGGIPMAYIIFSLMFLGPGVLYLMLAAFVAKRRRWAIVISLALAMLDMTLLGILFVTSWGAPGAATMCLISGLFVVALGVMTTYLGRSLEVLKQSRAA
jgi:hypothetical protein